ncbi:radical SAM protein [Candidatus Vidania fulgoroideorum]
MKKKIVISNGCNNNCSFCIVPFVRGKEKYKSLYNIILEIYVKKIVISVLLGQNVSSYNFKNLFFKKKIYFDNLIKFLDKIYFLKKIDFITSNPKDFLKKNFIKNIFSNSKISKYLHLPLQSGSNKVLKDMKRKYNIKEYSNIVTKIKKISKKFFFGTDIMINFFETIKDFKKTIKIINYFKYDKIYFFKYCSMPNTLAYYNIKKYKNYTKLKINILKKISKNNIIINSIKMLGKKIKIIVIKKNEKIYICRSYNNRKVYVSSKKKIDIYSVLNVRILNFYNKVLFGINES